MKMSFGRKTMVGAIGTFIAIGIGLMVLGAVGIAGWEYTNSDQFCESTCHAVHPEEIDVAQDRGPRPGPLRRVPHGPQFDPEAHRDEAHAPQGTVGHDRRLRASAARIRIAPGARGLRGLPLPADRASRQHRGQQALRHRSEEQRDRIPADAAHECRCAARRVLEGFRHPLAHRKRRAVQEPGRAGTRDSLGPDHEARRHEDRLYGCRVEALEGRPREARAAPDGVLQLPQRGGPSVPEPGRPRGRGHRGGQDRPRTARREGARRRADQGRRRPERPPGRALQGDRQDHRRERGEVAWLRRT